MLEIKQLTKKFKKAGGVENINFKVFENELVGFVGDNGAGKTTTIKLIFGELKSDSGSVFYNGKDLRSGSDLQEIAFFPDTNNVPMDITIERYLNYVSALRGMDSFTTEKRKESLLEMLELTKHKNKKIKELSAGLKKRAIMASCLITKPKIIFLDEPTANLDVQSRIEFVQLLKKLNQLGVTIFITTHNLEELQEIIDHLIIIKEGNIIYDNKFDNENDNIASIYKKFVNHKSFDLQKIEKIFGDDNE